MVVGQRTHTGRSIGSRLWDAADYLVPFAETGSDAAGNVGSEKTVSCKMVTMTLRMILTDGLMLVVAKAVSAREPVD